MLGGVVSRGEARNPWAQLAGSAPSLARIRNRSAQLRVLIALTSLDLRLSLTCKGPLGDQAVNLRRLFQGGAPTLFHVYP